jgi:hypothetical protein
MEKESGIEWLLEAQKGWEGEGGEELDDKHQLGGITSGVLEYRRVMAVYSLYFRITRDRGGKMIITPHIIYMYQMLYSINMYKYYMSI